MGTFLTKFLSLIMLLFVASCGSGNQDAIDEFFGVGEEDEADTGLLTYTTKEFREAIANDGSIENKINITVKGRLFVGTVGEEFLGSKLIVTNLPTGLNLSAQYLDNKEVEVTVTGNANSHTNLDDISNVTFDFDDSAFNRADNIAGKQSLVAVNYRDPYALNYDKTIINESGDNDGSIIESFNVSVNDLEFDGNLGEDFVGNGKVTITNVPAGLTGQATKVGPNIVAISLSGNAASHITTDDISNLTVIFNSPAFPSGVNAAVVANTTVNNLGINFFDPATVTYLPLSETFTEAVGNVGAISNQLTVSVTEDTFSGNIGEDYIASGKVVITNVPSGLIAQAQKITANDVSITLAGQASNHTNVDDIANLGVTFNATAFSFNTNITNVNNAINNNIIVDFLDPYVLSFDTKQFFESGDNDGSISTTVTGTLSGINFAGLIGDNLAGTGQVSASNWPSGVGLDVIKTSANTVSINLTGNALNHEVVNNITNAGINFLNAAFSTGVAAGVQGADTNDFSVNFRDPVTLSYSGEVFFESNSNDGTISNEIDITLSNDLLTGVNGENLLGNGKASIAPNPVTTGITAVLERISDTQLKLRLNGTAVASDTDITGITLSFNNTAFVNSTSTANINGAIKNNLSIDFLDVLSYSGTSVMERAANDGQIDETINLSLTGTQFTGTNGDNLVGLGKVVVTNVPTGLAAVIIKNSDTTATLSFTGTAANHEVADDVTNMSISFQNSAFASGNSVGVTNNSIANFEIHYLDPVTVAYDTNVFVESIANDGSISNPIVLTLSGDTFTGSNGDEYLGSGKVTLAPAVPAGLTASLIKTSPSTLTLTLSGNATVHEIDEGPFTLTLDASAFTLNSDTSGIAGVSRNDILINYNDALTYSTRSFSERAENDGQIDTVSVISLTGTALTGANGSDYIIDGKVAISNLPVGLTATIIKNSSTQLTMSIAGTAASHTSSDDIANLSLTFSDSAFASGVAASVANSTIADMSISYLDPVALSYASDTFNENSANDGSIQNSIDITLSNDTFTGSNGDDFIADGKASVSNIPVGLTAELRRISATVARFSLVGNAASNSIDVSNVQLVFNASALTVITNTVNVLNETKSDIKINYFDTLTYSTRTLTERALNDGQITETIAIQISGTALAGSNGDDFIATGRVLASNIPSGMTAVLIRNSSTQLTFSLTGTAPNNESADSVTNGTISFLDSALSGSSASTLENATINDLNINFFDSVAISYSSDTFNEALSNDGAISNTLTLTAINDTFTGTNGENFLSTSKATIVNVPAGLTATLVRTSSSTLQLSLNGNAIDHGDIHDISNVSVTIRAAALTLTTNTTNVLNETKSDINVDYISPSVLDYDSIAFTESSSNNGAVANNLTIDIDGFDSFTGIIGDDFIADGKVSVSNIPTGFTARVEKTASKQVRFILTGNALAHEQSDSVSNITISFTANAFVFNNDVSLVGNNSLTNVEVNYRDAAALAYSATSFSEEISNIGAVDTTANIDLANDTFEGSNGEDFIATGKVSITNVPAGLSPTLVRISATRVQLQFAGNAVNHALANSVSNLTINFLPGAFSFNTDTTTIANAQRSNLAVDFVDPYQLSYSSSTFSETAANTGVLSGSVSVTLAGTTFSGSNGDDFASNGKVIVSNLPAGLTAVVTRTNANQMNFTITGNAVNHANLNDIVNLTLNFQSSAFSSGSAAGVLDSIKNDFIIDFIDPYTLSFDTLAVTENIENIGKVTEELTITLGGHQFSGSNGDDFVVGGKVAMSNVPAGLIVTVVRDSATQLTLTYTGTASAHTNANDISTIGFTLQDSALVDSALAADVVGFNPSNLSIDFLPPYTLAANGFGFDEAGANNGSVVDTITYTLVGTTFAGANGRDLVADGDITMTNVPAGLTAVVTKIDTNNVTLSFSGNALNHAVADNSANTQIDFLAGAFTSGNANGVTPNSFSGLTFSWDDPPSLSFSPLIFNESVANIGGTNTSVSIFAANKTFDGALAEDFVAAGKVVVSSFPAGLTPVVTYASPNQVNLTFTGAATSNDDADDLASGITVIFNDSAFVGGNATQVVNSTFNGLGFDFLDPYQINYASSVFNESSLNNGSISNTLSVTLSGTLYSGTVGEDYTANSKATVNNVPPGLTAVVTKLSSSLAEVTLTGNANDHEASDSISNLEVIFADTAFTSGAAGGVSNSTKSDVDISYNDTAVVSYASSTFTEAVGNIGAVGNTIIISLANDTFNGPNGENFISTGKVAATNVPVGFIVQVNKVSDTSLSFELTNRALAHEDVHDVSNVTLSFAGSAFSFNSNAAAVTGSTKNDFDVDFNDAYQLSYASSSFNEALANDGSVTDTVVLTLTGTTFTGSNSDDFVADSKVTITNVPAGLTPVMTRTSNSQLTMSFTGSAGSHADSNDVSNVSVIFADTAFTSGRSEGVNNYTKTDIGIDFVDPPFLTYVGGSFAEAVANTGGVSTTVDVNITNATFSGADSDIYTPGSEISFSNVPAGLTAQAQKIDATTVRLSFTGSATSHSVGDSIGNFGVQFNNAAFNTVLAANITGTSKTDYAINFINPYAISYGGNTFTEAVSNIGAINTSINITLVGTTFTGANGAVYTNGVHANFLNLPTGLTPRLTKINDTTIQLSFTGAASSHALANSVTNFGISLLDPVFTSGAAAGVSNNSKIDFNINYADPYTITYSLPGFQESSSNNGAVGTTINVDLLGTTFTGTNGSTYTATNQYNISNIPAGLTANVFKVSSTRLTIFLTGSADDHEDVDDIFNLTFSLTDNAFVSGAAAGVLNNTKLDFFVDFIDAATLAYSAASFSESASNIGQTGNALVVTLTNDTFSGINGENYVATGKVTVGNIPAGMNAIVSKTSAATVEVTLGGAASNHADANDISNLSVTFTANAFNFNSDATVVAGYTRSDIAVDFIDPYSLAYAPETFSEGAANDGSIGNNIIITVTGSNFTTTGSDFISEGKLSVSNIPSGLAASVTRDSATQLTLSLTGNASNNLDSNDISNLTVTFADSAFTTGAAAGVTDSTKSNLAVDFNDQPSIAYAGSTFTEADSNIGAVSDTLNVILSNATFTGIDGAFYNATTEFTANNVPAGLTLRVQKISSTQVQISLSGAASSHAVGNSITNMGIQFLDAAFNTIAAANVDNNSKSDFAINFVNPYTMGYSGSSFSESVSNTGAISSTVNLTVSGTTFTGTNGVNYTDTVEYSSANLPTGLVVQVQKISSTVLQLSFTGAATSHALTDSITNFTLNLLDAAFTSGAAAGVNDTTKSDFALNFIDPYTIAYTAGGFNESGANDGSFAETIDIDVTGTTFTGANGGSYVLSTHFSVANVPAGLAVNIVKFNSTKLRVSLTGSAAANTSASDISNLTINLLDSAFTTGAAAGVIGSTKSDLTLSFADNASLAYSAGTFDEAVSNIGAISTTITLTLTNDTFSGVNGDNFVASSKASVTNLPSGLGASVTRTSPTTVDFTLTGAATANLDADDISNLSLTFAASAFDFNTNATTVTNYTKTDINIDYIDQYSLAYAPGTFTEGAANDGSIGNSVVITLTGSNFTTTASDFITESKVAVTNIPTGLAASVVRDSATQLTLSLTGNASNNLDSNDISNLTVTFADTAFTTGAAGGVDDSTKTDLNVDFNDQPSIIYAASTFTEATSNIGVVGGTIDINLSNATFTGSDASLYTSGVEFSVSNVPTGLVARVQKISSTQLQLSFTGTASNHAVVNNVTNIGIQLNNAAFNVVAAANVTNNSKADFAINYRDPYTLAYSGSAFSESAANIGAITNTVNVTVSGTTFTGANGANFTDTVEYTVGNLPAGLGVQIQKVSDTVVQLSFTGSAAAHANADSIANFTVNFLNGAFTSGAAAGVNGTTKSDFAINYIDPYTIAYSGAGFSESGANNGSFTDIIDLDITGTTFTGSNGATYTATTEYTVANVPGGLTLVVTKVNGTKLRLSLTGTAAAHASANDISNLTLNLLDAAFTTGASAGVVGSSKNDLTVNYVDNASIAYSVGEFDEDISNTGSIATTINLTLTNDTFSGVNGDNFISSSKASVANLPSGLTAVLTRTSATTMDFVLTGSAVSNLDADDISNLSLTFAASAFDFNTDATTVTNYEKTDIIVDFIDQYSLAYAPGTFSEGAANDGSIGNTVVITLTGSTFTTTASDFITESKVAVTNIPTGLSAAIVRDSATQLTLSLTGNASNNLDSNDISNLTVSFNDSAFVTGAAGGVDNSTKSDINVDFNDQPTIAYTGSTFTEALSNTGQVSGTVDINLSNATFTGADSSFYTLSNQFTVTNLPAGLTLRLQKISSTQLQISFTGSATSHAVGNSITNLGLQLTDNAFNVVSAVNVTNNSKSDFAINYRDPYTLAYSGSAFFESVANTGAINTTVNVTVSGTTFTGANGAVYTNGVEYSFANLPAGLGVQLQKISATVATLSFTSSATTHANANSITNFTLNLLDSAFTSGAAAGVNDTTKADFALNFVDPYSIAYSATGFSEGGANDGSFSDTIDLDITGTTFTGSNGATYVAATEYTVANVPAGLTAVVTKINSTKLRLSLTGNASPHVSANDASNLTITLLDAAITSGAAAGVIGSSKADLTVNFADNASIAYSATVFDEAASNVGAISTTLTLTLSNDIFAGINGENYVSTGKASVSGLPAGLTGTITRTSNTTVDVAISGEALFHANANDISTVGVTFASSAFDFNTDATTVTNYTKTDLDLDFIDPYVLAYSIGTFSEAAANNGSIANSVIITLSGGSSFTTTGSDFITESKVSVTNVPTGLTAVVTRDSATQLTLSLAGNATNNADSNDVSTLSVVFADSAFTTGRSLGVTGSTKTNFIVDFNDAPTLAYSASSLTEALSNTGAIAGQIDITLTNDTFTGTNGDIYTGAKVSITGVPAGLGSQVQKISDTVVRLTYTGSATAHTIANNISSIALNFQNLAFSNVAATNIVNSSKSDLALTFRDPYTLAYSTSNFNESVANNGSIGSTVDITLTGTTFTGTNGAVYAAATQYTVANTPGGLTPVVTKLNDTTLRVSFTGNATVHDDGDDVTNFTLNLLDAAFTSGAAAGVTNTSKADFVIDYLAPASLSYSGLAYAESNLNNGSITDTITIDIVNDTFTGATNSDPVGNGDIVVNNLPAGLTAVGQKINSTRIVIALSGTATNHADLNDISNLEFVFQASAFTNNTVAANVTNFSTTNISIDYEDPYVLSYSTTSLSEAGTNNGAVNDTIVINLTGTTFTGADGSNFAGTKAAISNHPTGLTPVLTKNNNNQLTLSFTGTASVHTNAQDVSNVTIVFADSAFASGAAAGVNNSTVTNISIDFSDLAAIAYSSGTFTEAGTNVGIIGNTITLTLSDDTFSGTNGDDFAGNGNATVSNVPAGLTATLVRATATSLTLSLTGSASSHANANDITNLEVVLAASAFTFNTNASLVTNSTKSDIAVNYDDPYVLTYSGLSFTEAATNNGSISATINLDLVGTTFTGINSDDFVGAKATVANVPTGLTAVLTRTSNSQLQLSFTGNATNNENSNSISNLNVTLNNSAFTSGAAGGVTDSTKNGLSITFNDKPVVSYSTSVFDEDLSNTGSVSGAIVIDIVGDTFTTGAFDGSKVSVSNVPAGMGFSVTRNSASQVQLNLTGSATSHEISDNIANLGISFLDAAFDNVAASNITGSSNSALGINFRDPYTLAFSSGTFVEAASNNGEISTSITATVSGTGFNTPAISMLVDGMVSVNNIPSGLNASVIRDSSTQVTISFTGSADDHANADSITNLEVIFNDNAFFSGESDGVTGSTKSDFNVNYLDPASIAYSTATFSENLSNDGSISNFIDITVSADTFTGAVSDNFAGTKATITNVPPNLTATLIKQSATVVRLSLTGNATNHENVNDIANLTVEFDATAFTNNTVAANVTNYLRNDLNVDYIDAYQLAYSVESLEENIANDGSITATIGISLTGTTFVAGTDFILESKVTSTNEPGGLTPVLTRVDATNLTLSFTGNASAHELVNSITNYNLTFLDAAITTGNAAGIVNFNKADINLNFKNQAVISYSTDTFNEASANDGSIGNSINISISDDQFTGANGSDFIADGKVTITNVPALYTATLTKISGSTLTLALSGAVLNGDHEDVDDISNIEVTFLNTAVLSNRADLVSNRVKSDVKINYSDVILPAISAVTPPANAYYTLAQTLTFTVAYSEDVDVVGTPRIVFDIDGSTVYANYTGGDGTSTLIFEYTTIAAQQDLDGITISSSTIDVNGGSIKKAGDAINDALVSFTVPNTSNVFVDTITPNTITALALTAPGNTAVGSESPTITWTNPSTGTDNIDHIEIALGTAAGANNIIDYTDIGDVETFQFTGITPDLTQCNAASPKYFPVVRVHDDANNISSTISNTPGFLFDSVDPLNPAVTTTTFDANNTRSATITWSAGSDACGVASYEMAIGEDTNANGSLDAGEVGNVVTWTDVGNVLTANLTGLTLTDNTNYYTSVRTVDITGRDSGNVGATSARWRANFNYRRDVTIAPATTVTDSHVKVTLNSGNFTYANAQSDLSDLRFFTTTDVALNYWIEYHDATDETRIWVKIPNTGTSTIVMKYGTENLTDGQDKPATFSYATAQDLYVEMSGASSNNPMNIASYSDSNVVTVPSAATTTFTIDEGDVQLFTSVDQGVIQTTGGISGRVLRDNRAHEAVVPISEAVTSFGYSVSRRNDDKYVYYNPNSTDATVTLKGFRANGNTTGEADIVTTVTAGGFASIADADTGNNAIVLIGSSDIPIVPFYQGSNTYDGNVQPQTDIELFGVPSSQGWVSCIDDGTTFTVYRSSNSLVAQNTYACNDGQRINISDSSYSQGLAPAIRIVSNKPIFGTSSADSDGLESAAFMGLSTLDRDYIIPANSEYIVMACPYPSTNIEVFDETGSSIYSNTCNANGNFPGKDKLLATQFSLSRMPPGYRIKSNKPFYVMYEYENQDETSVFGAKGARKYLETPLVPTVSGTEY